MAWWQRFAIDRDDRAVEAARAGVLPLIHPASFLKFSVTKW
jgi:hypothetical protein